MNTQKTWIIFALVAALGIVTIEAVDLTQEAVAAGCLLTSPAFEASEGRCFRL
jgi:hypothetical protein